MKRKGLQRRGIEDEDEEEVSGREERREKRREKKKREERREKKTEGKQQRLRRTYCCVEAFLSRTTYSFSVDLFRKKIYGIS